MPQGFSPFAIAITNDGKYAYLSFDLSEVVFKVNLQDFTVDAVADLSAYFPIESEHSALDAGEKKLFVYTPTWRKLLVLDTQTMSLIHTIDGIDAVGMIRSQNSPMLIVWNGNTVKFINTETYEVTELIDERIGFLSIRESATDPDRWYVLTAHTFGIDGNIVGIYNYKTKVWKTAASFPDQGGIHDFTVLPNELKAYAAALGGWYPGYHAYGSLSSIDLVGGKTKVVPVDGGALCLKASRDNQMVIVGTGWPIPNVSNLLLVDTQSDSVVGRIDLGRNKYGWSYTQMNDLQIDPANPHLLYATSSDANAFSKVDLNTRTLVSALILNQETFRPHFFAKRPVQTAGFILVHQSPYAYELDLDSGDIKGVVRFPAIRPDAYAYDVAFYKTGKLLIAQGEQVLEVSTADMSLLATHQLPPDIAGLWNFTLSQDGTTMYSVWSSPSSGNYPPDNFLAISTSDFHVKARFRLEGGGFNCRPYELPGGSKLYVLGGQDNGPVVIHAIATNPSRLEKTITFDEPGLLGISAGPYYPFAYDSASHTLFVGASRVVLAIDTDADTIRKVIHLRDAARAIGLQPWQLTYCNATGLAYQPQENYLYIAHLDRSFVSIYDLNNSRFLSQAIPLKGYFPNYIFTNDDHSKIYSLNTRSDNVSVIDTWSKTVEKVIDLHTYLSTAVEARGEIPREFGLSQNYPNPFNPSTTIRYALPCRAIVTLTVHNTLGQIVTILVNGEQEAGYHEVKFDGSRLASGVYFCRIRAGSFMEAKKLMLLR
jgi:YVTN family beta-propeller protein